MKSIWGYKYQYKFLMEMFDSIIDCKQFEHELTQGKKRFNRDTHCGEITEFGVLNHGVIVTYETNVELKCPNAALGRLSRNWVEDIPQIRNAVVNRRLCREVDSLDLRY